MVTRSFFFRISFLIGLSGIYPVKRSVRKELPALIQEKPARLFWEKPISASDESEDAFFLPENNGQHTITAAFLEKTGCRSICGGRKLEFRRSRRSIGGQSPA